jgi:hypothetical protein
MYTTNFNPNILLGPLILDTITLASPEQSRRNYLQSLHQKIKVITIAKGTKCYIGITRELFFDPVRWHWNLGKCLMAYTTRLDRLILNSRRQLTKPSLRSGMGPFQCHTNLARETSRINIDPRRMPHSSRMYFIARWQRTLGKPMRPPESQFLVCPIRQA